MGKFNIKGFVLTTLLPLGLGMLLDGINRKSQQDMIKKEVAEAVAKELTK